MNRNIFGIVLATSLILPGLAQAACDDYYKAKLDKIESKRTIRKVGNIAATVVIAGGVTAAYTAAAVASMGASAAATAAPMIAFGTIFVGGVTGSGTYAAINFLDREDRLATTYYALKNTDITEEELKEQYHARAVASKVERMNAERKQNGLPALTESEIAAVAAATPKEKRNYVSLDSIIWQANRRLENNLSFEEVRDLIKVMNEREELCPLKNNGKRKLLSPRQVGKLIASQIENQ